MQLSDSIVRASSIAGVVAGCAAALPAPVLAVEQAAGAIDTSPPVLHAIQVSGRVDAQAVHQAARVELDLTDDLSGIVRYAIAFRSPSDAQGVVRIVEPGMPAKKVNGTITIGAMPFSDIPLTEFAEPGTWRAQLFYAYDANGNFAGYSGVELQRLGSTTFEVTNDRYDIVPPALASGRIRTPAVRLSKPPKGTPPGTPPYVGAEVAMTDSGNGAVSGVYSARMIFCADDCAHSFSITGVASRRGMASATVTLGAELDANQRPGSYEPFALILEDVAGNDIEYASTAFGGDTDFGQYFPDGSTIVVDK